MYAIGLYGNGFIDWLYDEMELGKRVAAYLDSENNAPEIHFCDYGIERPDHWLHFV